MGMPRVLAVCLIVLFIADNGYAEPDDHRLFGDAVPPVVPAGRVMRRIQLQPSPLKAADAIPGMIFFQLGRNPDHWDKGIARLNTAFTSLAMPETEIKISKLNVDPEGKVAVNIAQLLKLVPPDSRKVLEDLTAGGRTSFTPLMLWEAVGPRVTAIDLGVKPEAEQNKKALRMMMSLVDKTKKAESPMEVVEEPGGGFVAYTGRLHANLSEKRQQALAAIVKEKARPTPADLLNIISARD